MKRVLCIVLTFVVCLSLFGCGKNLGHDEVVPSVGDEPTKKPSGGMQPIDTVTKLQSFDEYFASDRDEWAKYFISINENVKDIKEYGQELYILTDKGFHNCGAIVMFSETIPIDVSGLVSIYDVSDYYVIFIDENGKYVVYGKTDLFGDYVKCDFDVSVTNGMEYVAINKIEPSPKNKMIYQNNEFIYVVHDCFDGKSFPISVYGLEENDGEFTFKQIASRESFEMVNVTDKELKCYYTSRYDRTKGVALFRNGDLHLFKMAFDKDTMNGELYIYDEFISGVSHVFPTRENDYYFMTKTNDEENIYLCRRHTVGENEDHLIYETKIPLPSDVSTKKLIEFIGRGLSNEDYYVHLDGEKWLELKLNRKNVDSNQTVDEFIAANDNSKELCLEVDENDIVLRTYKPEFTNDDFFVEFAEKVRGMAWLCAAGYDVFLLDDGKLYVAAEVIEWPSSFPK